MRNNHAGRAVNALAFAKQLDDRRFPVEGRLIVTTRTGSVYYIDCEAGTITKNAEAPKHGFVQGATFGGSMLMVKTLLIDAYMEFVVEGETFRSSLVTSIVVAP